MFLLSTTFSILHGYPLPNFCIMGYQFSNLDLAPIQGLGLVSVYICRPQRMEVVGCPVPTPMTLDIQSKTSDGVRDR